MFDIARSLFYACYLVGMLRVDSYYGFGKEIDTCPSWYIIEKYGQRAGGGKGMKVLIQPLLRRLVVVRTDAEKGAEALQIGGVKVVQELLRVVASESQDEWQAVGNIVAYKANDVASFVGCECGGLGCCA